jgi:HEPN domain-containing protein
VIRQSQEAVELLLKASLRLVGIEPPKWHDVGPILRKEAQRFPEWFQQEIPRLARISRKLRREREPAMYGDEELGLPPEEIYDRDDAVEALQWASEVSRIVHRLYEELSSKSLNGEK